MSAITRRLVQESIDLTATDATVSDELPQAGTDVVLGMPELDINQEVEEVNNLIDTVGTYQTIMSEYPEHRMLNTSEEKFFTTIVNMSLAGTGITADDLNLIARERSGVHVSKEELSQVAIAVGRAIADAIRWIIKKIHMFWEWLSGVGGGGEERKDRATTSAVKDIPEPVFSKLDAAIEKVATGQTTPNQIIELGDGVVLHNDIISFTNKRPGADKGKTTAINLRSFMYVRWKEIDLLFSDLPEGAAIDVTKIPSYLKGYLDQIAKFSEPMAKLNSLNEKIAQYSLEYKRMQGVEATSSAISNLTAVGNAWKDAVKTIEGLIGNETVTDDRFLTHSKPLTPSGLILGMQKSSRGFLESAPWYDSVTKDLPDVFCGYIQPATFKPNAEDKSWHLKFGGSPSAIANTYDSYITAYAAAFKKVAPAQDEAKLRRVLNEVTALGDRARDPVELANGANTTSTAYLRDLMTLQFLVSRSQAGILNTLVSTVKMIGQHRRLYEGLRQKAVSDNSPKK